MIKFSSAIKIHLEDMNIYRMFRKGFTEEKEPEMYLIEFI